MNAQDFDSFIRDLAPKFAFDAWRYYRILGRGMLVVSDPVKDGGRFRIRYAPLAEVEALGMSAELLDHIRSYEPATQSVLYVECGQRFRMLLSTFERRAGVGPTSN
jgi:hypothetical protein